MSYIHMDHLLTADAEIDEQAFEASIRRLSVGSSATNASSHGPPTPSPSMSATSSFTGETVSPSLLLSSDYQDMNMEKSYSASLLGYGQNPYLAGDYPVLSSVHTEYIRPTSTIESFPTSATMSPLSMDSFYHSPASSFGSDSTFDEGHDAAAIAVARAAMPRLLHDEDVDDEPSSSVASPFLSMISLKNKNVATVGRQLKKPHAQQTNILTIHHGVGKRRPKRNYPEYIPGQETKPHQCLAKGCNARFKRQEHLKRHERTHTGERPFYCDVSPDCGRYFSRSDNLRQHKKTHYQFNPRGRNKFVGHQTDINNHQG
ncbi:hypothetical protein AA313_de0210038 [Arthrobotrys entomopaga]|nr:hypothetical protein AA313_de0210038 [Arthrobotrys entomopaga]